MKLDLNELKELRKLDFNELKKRFRTRSALAVTIESGRIAVNLVRSDETGAQVPGLSIPLGDSAVLEDPDKAGNQLVAALGAAGIR